MNDTKVLIVIAFNGYQHIEYGIPRHIIQDAGFNVITASDKLGFAVAQDGSTAHVDITLDKIMINLYAGIIFVGGPGALEHLDNNTSYTIIQDAIQQNIPIGAICIATRILAHAGILEEKYATGWNEDNQLNKIYKEYKVHYLPQEDVVIDDNIITATGPAAAQQFSDLFVEMLQKKQSWG
jgi:protease I